MGRVRYWVAVGYQPMSLAELARFIAAEPDFDTRWRLVAEFLKEYHQDPDGARQRLRADAPGPTGDERWDVLLAGLAEHRHNSDPRSPVSLRVELVGRVRGGDVVARLPRRTFFQWLLRKPRPYRVIS